MYQGSHFRLISGTAALLLASLLAWPAATQAQSPTTVTGDAAAVRATLLGGANTSLSDTGTLSGPSDAREASQVTGDIPSLLSGETLHAVTLGWPDEVDSEAAVSNLNVSVAGLGISADLVMSRASQVLSAPSQGSAILDNLLINGVPIDINGLPNQTVASVNFRVRTLDAGEPGSGPNGPDRFGLKIEQDGAFEAVVVSTRFLAGGNIQLHKPNPSTTGPNPPPDQITACHVDDSGLGP